MNLHLFLQWDSGVHSLSQDPTELGAPMFDGLESSSRSTELAPSVPRRGRGRLPLLAAIELGCEDGEEREDVPSPGA